MTDGRGRVRGPDGVSRNREARRALTGGLVLVAMYAALAAWSGYLSPLARGPLLDGLAPVNYRWVSPPPELASTNQEPASGSFELPIRNGEVGTQVLFTDDNQVTVVVDEGSISAPDQRAVELRVEPVDPAHLASPGGELAVFGNAYRLTARSLPSRDRVHAFDRPIQTILVYPATSILHATTHELLFSRDGQTWQPLETTDAPGAQQAEAEVPGPGYVVVAGMPAPPSAGPSGAGTTSGTPPLAVALLVAAVVVFVIGIGLLIRSRAGH